MDNILNKVHKRVLNEMLNTPDRLKGESAGKVIDADQKLRKAIAEFYAALEEARNPDVAVELLADHAAIIVEMIREFKSRK